MKKIDVNVLLGHWPYRKLYKEGLSNMKAYFEAEDVSCGIVSSMSSMFYNDAFEGDEDLYAEIGQDKDFRMLLTLNPKVPGWKADLEKGIKDFHICGVKIFPALHGYRLEDDDCLAMVRELEKYNLPLVIAHRMEDERNTYLSSVSPLDRDAYVVLVKKTTIPVVIQHLLTWEVAGLSEILDGKHNCYIDTSGLRGATFPIEEMMEHASLDTIMFGTAYPMLTAKASTYIIERAKISDEDKEKLFYKNAEKVFLR